MDHWEYIGEWGRWRRTVAGPKGRDYHQWDNISGELIPVQQSSHDMRSVPRSFASQEYDSLDGGYRDPWGYKQDGPHAPAFAFDGAGLPGFGNLEKGAISEEESQPYLNYRHPNGHQQSNYTLGPKSSTPNPDRLINSWGESSYPRRNRATPVEAVVAGFAGRPRATYVDGYGNYTLPLSEPPENNDLGGQTITARGHSNAFGHPDKCDSATDSDRNADRMMDPKLPNSGYTEASYGFRETSNRYSEQKASAKSDADFRIDFGRRTE